MVCMQTAPLVPTPATRDEISSPPPPSSSDGTDVPHPPRATQSNGIELFPLIFNFPTFATAFRDRGKRGMINRIGVIPTNDLIRLNLPSSLRRFPGRGDG